MKIESAYATRADFNRAPVGHPFMDCCNVCGEETGELLMKMKGHGNDNDVPRFMVGDNSCEFCHFVGVFMASEGIESCGEGEVAKVRYGAAKIVSRDTKTGIDKLIAYVPFSELEDGLIPIDRKSVV